jgi:hypothetical protein
MRRISMTYLKKKYPNPISAARSDWTHTYCVGGALCMEMGLSKEFPNDFELKEAWLKATGYDWYAMVDDQRDLVYSMVHAVIEHNDAQQYAAAWKVLGELLRYRP